MFAELDPIYRGMAERGFSVSEVDAMELWQVARFLGVKGGGVIRGAALRRPADGADDPHAGPIDPDQWGEGSSAQASQDMLKQMAGG